MMQQFTSLGVVGVIAYYLFRNTLDEKKQDREIHRQEMKEIRLAYEAELKEARDMYKEELEKDRVVYMQSIQSVVKEINGVVDRIEDVEQDVREIKEKI